jgi:hypothetical protein
LDKNTDGRFEITQWFDKSPWTTVMEVDKDGNRHPYARFCYEKDSLREKEIDEDEDTKPDLKESYSITSDADDLVNQLHGRDDIEHVGGFPDLLSLQKIEMGQAGAAHHNLHALFFQSPEISDHLRVVDR